VTLFTTLAFLTAIPLPRRLSSATGKTESAGAFFPLVGLLLGLVLAGLDWLLGLVLPPALANAGLLIALLLLTGLLHLDGFVDTCDGLGAPTAEEARNAMADSRVGSFGVTGAFSLLLLKYVSLVSLASPLRTPALVLVPIISRWAVVWPIFTYPYARPHGLGKTFKESTGRAVVAAATAVTLALSIALLRVRGLALMIVAWLAAMSLAAFLSRRFAGLTGDCYGAIIEASEALTLVLAALLSGGGW
jgi:adenosylcobinamide-GDP ribazoletransferase